MDKESTIHADVIGLDKNMDVLKEDPEMKLAMSTLGASFCEETEEETDEIKMDIEECSLSDYEKAGPSSPPQENMSKPLPASTVQSRCIFCSDAQKFVKGRCVRTMKCSSAKVLFGLQQQTELFGNSDHFSYHQICLAKFKGKVESLFPIKKGKTRQLHMQAFSDFLPFIDVEIIQNQKIFHLDDLFARYKRMVFKVDRNVSAEDIKYFKPSRLRQKIIKHYGDKIVICNNNKRPIVYKHGLDLNSNINNVVVEEPSNINKLQKFAYKIRNVIEAVPIKKTPEQLKDENLMEGECDIPSELFEFMCHLVQGPDPARQSNDMVRIKSICHDIMYAVSKGRLQPSKHVMLGLAMKSITSSGKVLTILNKLGSTIPYSQAKELESELACSGVETIVV